MVACADKVAPEIIVHNRAQARNAQQIVAGDSVRRNVPLSIALSNAAARIAQASARARPVVWVAVELSVPKCARGRNAELNAKVTFALRSVRARPVVWIAVELSVPKCARGRNAELDAKVTFALRSVRAHCAAVLAVENCVQTIARALIVHWNARVRNAARTACLMLAEIAPQVAQARAAARGNGKSTKLATHT